MNTYHWTSEHEAAYLEERKNKCEHCQPEHKETAKWLESISNQEILYAVYKKYGINPNTLYKEFEDEIIIHADERIVREPIEEVA